MSAIETDIQKALAESEAKALEAKKLAELHVLYPDLKKHTERWGKVAYYSKSVNGSITDYDARHNCGCCHDSPLEIWPYVITTQGKVYSDPPCFTVGERCDEGDNPYPGWDDSMRSAGVPQSIIDRVSCWFREEPGGP